MDNKKLISRSHVLVLHSKYPVPRTDKTNIENRCHDLVMDPVVSMNRS